jgi:hypothetical protein
MSLVQEKAYVVSAFFITERRDRCLDASFQLMQNAFMTEVSKPLSLLIDE